MAESCIISVNAQDLQGSELVLRKHLKGRFGPGEEVRFDGIDELGFPCSRAHVYLEEAPDFQEPGYGLMDESVSKHLSVYLVE